jgi:putative DNA primase/helicase
MTARAEGQRFLREVHRPAPDASFVTVDLIPATGGAPTTRWMPVRDGRDRHYALAGPRALKDAEVYFGVAPQARRLQRRSTARNAVGVGALWLDVDGAWGHHAATNLPGTKDEALAFVNAFALPPNIVVDSGGGLQVYWLLDELVDRERAEVLLHAWADCWDRLAAERGWKLDNTSDLARILRLPGTFNHKGGERRPVELVTANYGDRCPVDAVEGVMAEVTARLLPRSVRGRRETSPRTRPALAGGERLGDWFMRTTPWADILEPLGWVAVTQCGNETRWRRPGARTRHHDATTDAAAPVFKVFTASDPTFPQGFAKDKLGTYAHAHYGGDLEAGLRAIEAMPGAPRRPSGIERPPTPGDRDNTTGDEEPPTFFEGFDAGGPEDEFEHTDLGNAHRLVAAYSAELRIVPNLGWHYWSGTRWVQDDTAARWRADLLIERTQERARECGNKKLARWARLSQAHSRLTAVVALAGDDPRLIVPAHRLDANPWLLNCRNGTIDLSSGALRPHDPADLITKMAHASYHPDALAPRFAAALECWQPAPEMRDHLQRVAGCSLPGIVTEQKLVLLLGDGANGKTTYLEVWSRVMGDYAGSVPIGELMDERFANHRTYLVRLRGRRLVITSEPSRRALLSEATVKQLTGGDPIIANRMRRDPIEFYPTWLLVMAGNHRPAVSDTGRAIWRRLHPIPFTETIDDEDAEPELAATLARDEADGILAWMVEGCREWRAAGLGRPAPVVEAHEQYRSDEDVFATFVEQCLKLGDGDDYTEPGERLYRHCYLAWCAATESKPVPTREWPTKLREFGITRTQTGGDKGPKTWHGCKVVWLPGREPMPPAGGDQT